jgi:hypothetical protein
MANAKDMINQDRGFIYDRGNRLNDIAGQRSDNAYNQEGGYENYLNETYDPLIGGRGGYNDSERAAIQGGDLNGYRTSDDDLNSNYLSGQEGAAIQGNPADRMQYFNPDAENGYQDTSELRQRGAVDAMGNELNAAIDPGKLSLSADYGRNAEGALSGTEGKLNQDISRDHLTQDPTLASRYRMSDADVEGMATAAGTTTGNTLRSRMDAAGRAARGAGVDPLGIAALEHRTDMESAGEAGDAMTRARMQAKQEQAQREMNLENQRLGAEQGYAGMKSSADLNMGAQRLGQVNQGESMRLGANQDISNRQMGAAAQTGQARIGSEQAMRGQEMNQRQFNTTTGLNMAKDIDQTNSDRAKYMSENRQGVNTYNQGQRFNQGMATNQLASQRAQTIADQRRADAAEGRGYLRGQEGLKSGEQQAESNRQAAVYGTQAGLANQTSQLQNQAEAKPSTFDKIMGAAGGVLGGLGAMGVSFEKGGIVTEPTQAVLGEAGPEMVIPLGNSQQAPQAPPTPSPSPSPDFNSGEQTPPVYGTGRQFKFGQMGQDQPLPMPMPQASPAPVPAPAFNVSANPAAPKTSPVAFPHQQAPTPAPQAHPMAPQPQSSPGGYGQSKFRLRNAPAPMKPQRFNQPYRPVNQPQYAAQ